MHRSRIMVGKKLLLLMDPLRCVDGYIFTYKPLIFRRIQVLSSTRRRMKYHEEGGSGIYYSCAIRQTTQKVFLLYHYYCNMLLLGICVLRLVIKAQLSASVISVFAKNYGIYIVLDLVFGASTI
ncbi:uncharacterized protein [Arachis hypogaea]|uniref:uncharacterized protein isoform X2 n=2 Tax=Arachis TaxID=3817 RepID=UPI000DEDDA67